MKILQFLVLLIILATLVGVGGVVLRAAEGAITLVVAAVAIVPACLGIGGGLHLYLTGRARLEEARRDRLPPAAPVYQVYIDRREGETRPQQLRRASVAALDAQQGVVPWEGRNAR